MRNPPAFDKFLLKYQEQLVKVVPPEWLPEPVLVASKAAKMVENFKIHLKGARDYADWMNDNMQDGETYYKTQSESVEKMLAKWLKKNQTTKGFKEYGAGHYGVVYPTQKPGIVCKITTDQTEAQFVANAISLNKRPAGIVKYHAVFRFSGKSHKRRPVYIVWRDEAHPPVLASDGSHAGIVYQNALHSTKHVASIIRSMITGMFSRVKAMGVSSVWKRVAVAKNMEEREFYFFLPEQSLDMDKPTTIYNWLLKFKGLRIPMENKLAALFWLFKNGCDNLDMSHGFSPGHALWWYFENDMLLADVHANNVMKDQDGNWDISDPGHMIELSDRYANVKIPSL